MTSSLMVNMVVTGLLTLALGFVGWSLRRALNLIHDLESKLGEFKVEVSKEYVSKEDYKDGVKRIEDSVSEMKKESKENVKLIQKEIKDNTKLLFEKLDGKEDKK